ncbi:lysoplasmalogenase [Brucella thiophenivorans]|uniref:YhhN-like family protein n=1 Tax=Brucella thiophenivorans TaxID=571255 RepID=A0A256FZ13_9HYPH|nr:lysoplasmalogenase [Brucella thiophenivorans]OYR20072.1 yhhN-like family protein [Brucella thiophenivorans]
MRHKSLMDFGRQGVFYRLFLICAICAVLSSLLSQNGDSSFWRYLHYLTKPAATLLLLCAILNAPRLISKTYGFAIAIGLAVAAAGDFFLMLPGDYFLAGLICFLITHCIYTYALCSKTHFAENKIVFVVFAVLAIAIIAGLWSSVPNAMKIPVVIYASAIGIMAAQAFSRAISIAPETIRHYSAWLAAAGGLFFMVSDTLLAFNRFHTPIPLAGLWVLGTYYAAQFLFARSTENFAYER